MKSLIAVALAAVLFQNADSPDAHVARAKTAAGNDYQNLFNFLCLAPSPGQSPRPSPGQSPRQSPRQSPGPSPGQSPRPSPGQSPRRDGGPPERSTWYAEPVKVFDNLYF